MMLLGDIELPALPAELTLVALAARRAAQLVQSAPEVGCYYLYLTQGSHDIATQIEPVAPNLDDNPPSVWSGSVGESSKALPHNEPMLPSAEQQDAATSSPDWDFGTDEAVEASVDEESPGEHLPSMRMPPRLAVLFTPELSDEVRLRRRSNSLSPIPMMPLPPPKSPTEPRWRQRWFVKLRRVLPALGAAAPSVGGTNVQPRHGSEGSGSSSGIVPAALSTVPSRPLLLSLPGNARAAGLPRATSVPSRSGSVHLSLEVSETASQSRAWPPPSMAGVQVSNIPIRAEGQDEVGRLGSLRDAQSSVDVLLVPSRVGAARFGDDVSAQDPPLTPPVADADAKTQTRTVESEVDATERDLEAGPPISAPASDASP